jgi:hypothetical protein
MKTTKAVGVSRGSRCPVKPGSQEELSKSIRELGLLIGFVVAVALAFLIPFLVILLRE